MPQPRFGARGSTLNVPTRGIIGGGLALFAVAALALVVPAGARAVDPAGPVGHWALDEAVGSTAADSSGNGNTGALTGGTWTDGIAGTSALHFDGDRDRIVVADSPTLEPTTLGIAFWIRSDSIGEQNQMILRKGAKGCLSSYWLSASQGGLRLSVATPGAIQATSVVQGAPFPALWDGEWHHVIMNVEPTGSPYAAFLDGVPVGPSPYFTSSIQYDLPVQSLSIGRTPDCTGYVDFNGDLDDLRIYGRKVWPSEFQSLYDTMPLATTTTILPFAKSTYYAFDTISFPSTVAPNPQGGGLLFERWNGADWENFGNATVYLGYGGATAQGRSLDVGVHTFRARYLGEGRYQPSTSGGTATLTRALREATLTLYATDEPAPPGHQAALMALFGPESRADGPVNFYRIVDGEDQFIGTGTPTQDYIEELGAVRGGWRLQLEDLPLGTYQYRASFPGDVEWAAATSQVRTHVVAREARTVFITGQEPTPEHHSVRFRFEIEGISESQPNPWYATGTWTVQDTFKGVTTTIGTAPVTHGVGELTLDSLPLGTHSVKAVYSGDGVFAPSTSGAVSQVVTADSAEFSGPAVSLPKFYPVVDGYQDSVTFTGTRLEQLAMDITISNSGGGVVRRFSFRRGLGVYSQVWNGRDSNGVMVPAGTYTVRQRFRDGWANEDTWTTTVSIGHQKLVTKTGSVTVYADQYAAKGTAPGSSVTASSKYTRAMKLTSPIGGFAGVGYQFTLPSAISYSALSVSVLGSGGWGVMGLHDWNAGVWAPDDPWVVGYFVPTKSLAAPYAWTKLTGDPGIHRSDRTVQAIVYTTGSTYYVHKVQLAYSYKVLE